MTPNPNGYSKETLEWCLRESPLLPTDVAEVFFAFGRYWPDRGWEGGFMVETHHDLRYNWAVMTGSRMIESGGNYHATLDVRFFWNDADAINWLVEDYAKFDQFDLRPVELNAWLESAKAHYAYPNAL